MLVADRTEEGERDMNSSHRLNAAVVSSFSFWMLVACLGLLLSFGTTPAWGQSASTGTVSGQVTDQQNAIVPNAEIKMADPSTNVTLTTASNEAGRYIFVNVQPGSYNVTINHPGFAQARIQGQKVDVGSVLTLT